MTPQPERFRDIVAAFDGKVVVVLGDAMLDEFVWGKVRRISPEAPVPVVEVVEETYRLGGACNVASNIRALGGTPVPIGVIGNDAAGDRIVSLLAEQRIDSGHLVRTGRRTTLKTRVVAHQQQVVRADREDRSPLSAETNGWLSTYFVDWMPRASAIVISDYDKGVINAELMQALLPAARERNVPVFLDPKVHHADYYRPVTVITPNAAEAELLTGLAIRDQETLEEAGRRLLARFDCPYALVTRGEEGMSLFAMGESTHLPTFAREVFDVTGAGDTVVATLALAHAAGATMEEAATLANHAAGIVVGKVGTATVNRSELLADLDRRG